MKMPCSIGRGFDAACPLLLRVSLIGTIAAALDASHPPSLMAKDMSSNASAPLPAVGKEPISSSPGDGGKENPPLHSGAQPRQVEPMPAAQSKVHDGKPNWTSLAPVVVTARTDGYTAASTLAATRTDTPLIKVAQSVQILTRDLIEEQDRRTLADALVNVSGVVPNRPEEGLFAEPVVRGFPAEIYQDGLPMYGAARAANDPASLVGAARIDVLKGPTSTLYGGGVGSPLGGLINIESERPDGTPGGYVAMRGGSFSTVNPYGEVNVPLTSAIAARVAAEYQSNDSWIDRVKGKRTFVQPGISFQLSPQTDLLLQGQYSRRSQVEYSGLPAAPALHGLLDRNAFPGATDGQPQTVVENRMLTGVLRHAFANEMRLIVSGRFYGSQVPEYGSFIYPELYPAAPASPTVFPILTANDLTKVKESTLDANISAKADLLGGQHELLAGVDYDRTRFSFDMGFEGVPVGTIDLARPAYRLAFGARTPRSLTQTDRYQTSALYVQDQATYGRLHLTGSLRYTLLNVRRIETASDQTYRRVSPRIGATFDVVPGVALYAGYAGAFRAASGIASLQTPKPETSRNIEGGLKFALSRVGLSGTIAAFDQRRNNVATAAAGNPFYSVQTGQQRARGAETDLVWEPAPAFSLLANYAYTQAEVTRDNRIPIGDVLPRVPRHSGRLAARYRVINGPARGLSFGAGVTASSARQLTLPNSMSVPGYMLIDAQASYDFTRYTVELSITNLAGREAYDAYRYFASPVVMPVQPRSAYLTLKVHL